MRRYVLTERQYDLMKRGKINEAHGYPKFLDGYFAEIYAYVKKCVDNMIKNRYDEYEGYYRPKDTTYADEIFLNIALVRADDIFFMGKYKGSFSAESFSNGKLVSPVLNFQFPIDRESNVYYGNMYSIICHETEHLYDEWKRYMTSGRGNNDSKKNSETYRAYVDYRTPAGEDDLGSIVGKIGYLNNFSERNAFATQVYGELKTLGCTSGNYNTVMKETTPYKNYQVIKNKFIPMIKNASVKDLWYLNGDVFDNYPSSEIPKFDYHKKGMNDAELIERYRNKLIQWANGTFDRFMRKFYGVVYVYLEDGLKEAKMTIKPYMI